MSNIVTIIDTDEVVVRIETHKTGAVFLHAEVDQSKWDKSVYKGMKNYWTALQQLLLEQGIDEVFSIIPKDDMTLKFQKMFGLSPLIDFDKFILCRRKLNGD